MHFLSLNINQQKITAYFSREYVRTILSLGIIVISFLFFGLSHLSNFITADEHYWVHERIPQYWNAWDTGKWKKTYINDKPGVSLALISGASFLHNDTKGQLYCQNDEDGKYLHCDPQTTSQLYQSFRLPILLVNACILVLIFFSIRAFSGWFIATLATWFISVSPVLIGLSQILNPDALLWSFGCATLFSYIAFLKTGSRSYAYWASVSLLFALLSKYTALIILFFLPLIILLLALIQPSFSPLTLKKQCLWLIGISFVPLLSFMALVPGVLSSHERLFSFVTAGTGSFFPWVGYMALILCILLLSSFDSTKKINGVLQKYTKKILHIPALLLLFLILALLLGRFIFPEWDIFTRVPFDIKDLDNARYTLGRRLSFFDIPFLEFAPLVYGTPIITLIFALIAIYRSVFQKHTSPLVKILSLFLVFFMTAMSLSGILAIPRYIILCYPLLALLAAFGVHETWRSLPKRFQTKPLRFIGISCIVLASLYSVATSQPYYANYSNMLLPQHALISDSWGYGGYEAAQYLNTLGGAKELTVWSDYPGVCEFFIGRCMTDYTLDPNYSIDYYVLTRRGQIRYIPRSATFEKTSGLTAYRYYNQKNPIWSLNINNKPENFIKIFRANPEN